MQVGKEGIIYRKSLEEKVASLPLPQIVEQAAANYEQEALRPLILRRGKYREMIANSEKWVATRANLLRERLPLQDEPMGGAEGALRGFLLEMLGYEAINKMCREARMPYRALYAPYQLDMSRGQNKGGDILLVKEYEDGSCAPICLIDIKTKGGINKLRSGMHWGIQRPLPSIVIPMSGIVWEDSDFKQHSTKSFLTHKVRRLAEYNQETFLSLLSSLGEVRLLEAMRQKFSDSCDRTRACIQAQSLPDGLERELLIKLGITEQILGIYQDHITTAAS